MNESGSLRQRLLLLCLPVMSCISGEGLATTIVGKTEFARGAAAAQLLNQPPRLLGKDADVYRQDVIQTGPASFAIVGFQDATKVTVRPNSKLTVNDYLDDYAELGLHEGGVRGASGSIAKLLPGQFKIETPVATVEIHNAKFDVRYCESDCEAEEKSRGPLDPPGLASVVGRVATLRGEASSTGADGETRNLGLGAPLHEKDVVTTGGDSYALLIFRDASKVSLEPETEFHIEAQKYSAGRPEKNEAVYRFVRGGMRALTGAIGKESPEKFQVRTPVATTGIRGTGFDLACRGTCSSRRIQGSPEFITAAVPDGFYSLVWQGAILHDNDAGIFDLQQGRAGYIANFQSPMILLPSTPSFMSKNPTPRPDEDDTSLEDLFGFNFLDGVPPGLYVHVRWGHVRVRTPDGDILNLGTGEVGYVAHRQQPKNIQTGADEVPDDVDSGQTAQTASRINATCALLPAEDQELVSPEGCQPLPQPPTDAEADAKKPGGKRRVPQDSGDNLFAGADQPSSTAPVGQVALTQGDQQSDTQSTDSPGAEDDRPKGTPGTGGISLTRLQYPRAFLSNDPTPEPESANLNQNRITLLGDEDGQSKQFFECLCPI